MEILYRFTEIYLQIYIFTYLHKLHKKHLHTLYRFRIRSVFIYLQNYTITQFTLYKIYTYNIQLIQIQYIFHSTIWNMEDTLQNYLGHIYLVIYTKYTEKHLIRLYRFRSVFIYLQTYTFDQTLQIMVCLYLFIYRM